MIYDKIIDYYTTLDRDRLITSRLPYVYTEKGVWAGSSCRIIYDLFKKIKLQKYKNFIDLGSGDGRVVLLASLFTDAYGVESDTKLMAAAKKAKKKFSLKAAVKIADFGDICISGYEVVFINPDKPFSYGTEKKLLDELKGKLLVYNNLFLPRFLKQGRVHVFDGLPVIEYSSKI